MASNVNNHVTQHSLSAPLYYNNETFVDITLSPRPGAVPTIQVRSQPISLRGVLDRGDEMRSNQGAGNETTKVKTVS